MFLVLGGLLGPGGPELLRPHLRSPHLSGALWLSSPPATHDGFETHQPALIISLRTPAVLGRPELDHVRRTARPTGAVCPRGTTRSNALTARSVSDPSYL